MNGKQRSVILAAVALALLLDSCVPGPGVGSHPTPPAVTAQGVVLQPGDVPGVQKCPQSDVWAVLMLHGEPEMLPTGFPAWSDLQAAGATQGWLSLYADSTPECPLLLGSAPPKGRLVYTAVINFKSSSKAAASFKSGATTFPVAPDFADRFSAAGGKETRGPSTGFGENSAVATIAARGVPTYVAFWQNKSFDAVVYADNLSASEATQAVNRMNARIH
ncbi:MAG TPA: hypothetical protein VLK30_09560 [Candidatus Limnocylindrales bacterium]|nr:hypothetical protein [Candidatus Limnocylindrales bacterium]